MSRLLGAFSGRRFVQPPLPPPTTTTSTTTESSVTSIQQQKHDGPSAAIEAAASNLSSISSLTSVASQFEGRLGREGGRGGDSSSQINTMQHGNHTTSISSGGASAVIHSPPLHSVVISQSQQPLHISLRSLPCTLAVAVGLQALAARAL